MNNDIETEIRNIRTKILKVENYTILKKQYDEQMMRLNVFKNAIDEHNNRIINRLSYQLKSHRISLEQYKELLKDNSSYIHSIIRSEDERSLYQNTLSNNDLDIGLNALAAF